MTATVSPLRDLDYYDKEELAQSKTKKGRKDKENYYSESGNSTGFFYGAGSARLNLLNQSVTTGDLRKLVNGINPLTDKEFFHKRAAKHHGTDICLSAPKDFSILAQFDIENRDKFFEIFDNACKKAMDLMQEKTYRRIGLNKGKVFDVELIQLFFDHKTARPLDGLRPDPQWHRHCLTLRRCFDSNGSVKTIDNYALFNNQKLFGAVFRAELCNGLRELGYQVAPNKEEIIDDNFKRVKVSSFKVVGITDSMRAKFSNRSIEINKKAGDGASYLKKYSVAQSIKRNKVQYEEEVLFNIWNKDAESVGINKQFLNSIKTNSNKTILDNVKLEQMIILQSLSKGKLYESKLMLRLTEYEQFTGIKAKDYFKLLQDKEVIKRIKGFEFSYHLPVKNAEIHQKQWKRKVKHDFKNAEDRFTAFKLKPNMLMCEAAWLETMAIISILSKDKPLKAKSIKNTKSKEVSFVKNDKVIKAKANLNNSMKDTVLSIAQLELRLSTEVLSVTELYQIRAQLNELYARLEEEKKQLLNAGDEHKLIKKLKP